MPADAPPFAEGEPVPETPTEGLQLILGVDRISYAPGAPIRIRIQVVNRLDQPRILAFASGQRVDALLEDEGGAEVARWSDGQMFTQALGEERFDPGDQGLSWELELTAPEAPGSYRLRGILTSLDGTLEASLPVEVIENPSPNPDDDES